MIHLIVKLITPLEDEDLSERDDGLGIKNDLIAPPKVHLVELREIGVTGQHGDDVRDDAHGIARVALTGEDSRGGHETHVVADE